MSTAVSGATAPPGFVEALVAAVGADKVRDRSVDRVVYSRDVFPVARAPLAVVLARSTADVAAAVRACHEHGVPFTARGGATSVTGSTAPEEHGIVISLLGMDRVRHLDVAGRHAWVEPGVVNAHLSEATRPHGLAYAPDPSSQSASTIGGNVATNAGGPHCLKYGTTTDHVLGVEQVLPDGTVTVLGGPGPARPGPDLRSLIVGAEGTLGITTAVCVRLLAVPAEVRTFLVAFPSLEEAATVVSATVAAGIVPAALEMVDRRMINAIEDALAAGYPREAEAVLLIELEGPPGQVAHEAERVAAILDAHEVLMHREAADAAEREQLWQGRKQAFGMLAHIAPNYYIHDCVVPRSRLVDTLRTIMDDAAARGVTCANVFHAGDGNLHPLLLFDREDPGVVERVAAVGETIVRTSLEAGGALTGEHGVGLEKRRMMALAFDETDLEHMRAVREAVDPGALANADKVLPMPGGCAEAAAHAFDTADVAGSGLWI